jgi:DNA-binding NarL/FixJ family response regulator
MRLTERQLEVLQATADGMDRREIARMLYVTPDTVKTHLSVVYKAIGARNRAEAVALGFRLGWLR